MLIFIFHTAYPVGSQAIINAEHMSGMNGAEATISVAFDKTIYTVGIKTTRSSTRYINVGYEERHKYTSDQLRDRSEEFLNEYFLKH